MNISMSPTRQQYPLSPKKIIKKTIVGTGGWIIALLILLGVGMSYIGQIPNGSGYYFPMVVIALILIVIPSFLYYIYERYYFATYFYELDDDHITIRKGPITPNEITIPYERIQDVYVDQDIFDRILGLYDVHLSSATYSSGMAAHIDGVEKAAADGLRKQILDTVTARISRKPQNNIPAQAVQN
jgi:membrane protein YdbS with pleckstrin-like domain